MGAGKSTLKNDVAARLGRTGSDLDGMIENALGDDIPSFFRRHGEAEFRRIEENETLLALWQAEPDIFALGGGAVLSEEVRTRLRERAFTIFVEVDLDTAWERVREGDRPLAQDYDDFGRLYEARLPLYREVADAVVRTGDADGVVLAAGGVHVERDALELLGALVPGAGPAALVSDAHVAGIHGPTAQMALGPRLASTHELPAGEDAKTVASAERLWGELELERSGTVVALGGGCTTDAAGFVAATYLRGLAWVPVPTTLVGQVDAAIGGKTGLNLSAGKNLVGAFHWPVRTVIDTSLLHTLPERERRSGMAEVVKTGLLAGEPLWDLADPELVRRSAAYKTAVCLRDPHDAGDRAELNLGHTFAHALEAASDYELPHGDAVALGLRAALRLSGLDTGLVDEILHPRPVRVDPERAWAALCRDKKAEAGRPRLVLLAEPGRPRVGVEVEEAEVRRALDELIAG